jgi:hypothetical protein
MAWPLIAIPAKMRCRHISEPHPVQQLAQPGRQTLDELLKILGRVQLARLDLGTDCGRVLRHRDRHQHQQQEDPVLQFGRIQRGGAGHGSHA